MAGGGGWRCGGGGRGGGAIRSLSRPGSLQSGLASHKPRPPPAPPTSQPQPRPTAVFLSEFLGSLNSAALSPLLLSRSASCVHDPPPPPHRGPPPSPAPPPPVLRPSPTAFPTPPLAPPGLDVPVPYPAPHCPPPRRPGLWLCVAPRREVSPAETLCGGSLRRCPGSQGPRGLLSHRGAGRIPCGYGSSCPPPLFLCTPTLLSACCRVYSRSANRPSPHGFC